MSSAEPPVRAPSGRRRSGRRASSSRGPRSWVLTGGIGLLAAMIGLAPLAAGAVHRLPMFVLLIVVAAGLTLVVAAEVGGGALFRISAVAAVPALLLVIPALQSLPLPAVLQNLLDPAGAELLAGGPAGGRSLRAYSLDPPATRVVLGQSAAFLAVFLVAAHLASGRSFRQLLLRVVVLSGLAAVVIGVGHRILGVSQVYGRFNAGRAILNGPFINPNHTAQFLELAFFSALALAYANKSLFNRIGWLSAAAFLVAGALGTLSRGGVLALAVSGTLFLAFANTLERDEKAGRTRSYLFWAGLSVGLMAIVAASLGAGQLLAKFSQANFTQETRFRLWADSLKLLQAHPFGIGRGAFERVYPTVRSIEGNIPVRFSFVENEPLQFLLDTGWVGFAAALIGVGLIVREIYRHGRRDRIELALLCGLVAVVTHNFVDFGLETLGVMLPVAAVLGTVLGRANGWKERVLRPRATMGFAAASVVGAIFGAVSLAHSSSGDFDARIQSASTVQQRREAALLAQAAHPVDYFYVLVEALTEPLTTGPGGPSPRLRILNRALLHCPSCPEVHAEVARSLWRLGKRRQALIEWRSAVATRRILLTGTLEEAWRLGATADELPVLAGDDPDQLIAIASFLVGKSARAGARKVIDSALMAGASPREVHVLRAQMNLEDDLFDQALTDIAAVETIAPSDPRVFGLRAEVTLRSQGIGAALDVLDRGVAANPYDLPLQRRRLALVMENEKWSRAQGALEGLETALFHARLPTTEVRLAAARLAARLGDTKGALSEYRSAINQSENDPTLWMDLGTFYESLGRHDEAARAFREVQRILPDNAEAAAAIQRATDRQAKTDEETARRTYLTAP